MPYDIGKKRIFPDRFFAKFNEWESKEHIGKQYSLHELEDVLKKIGFKTIKTKYTFGSVGQLAWELDRITGKRIILKVLLMPLLKLLAQIAVRCNHENGNLLIMGQKI